MDSNDKQAAAPLWRDVLPIPPHCRLVADDGVI
jgi:hypothetical protein